ncbi:MAG: sulfatase/phosphatase domain-containing protein, partial [Mariniphaga sp.]
FYKKLGNDTVHLTRYTGEKALEFISKAPTNQPFCLSLSFSAPHAHDNSTGQYFWQKESDQLYKDVTIPDPQLGEDIYFNRLPKAVREGFNRLRWTWRFDTPEKYQQSVKGYYRMITEIDREIGKIRNKLKELEIDRNTVIIFMGDNGYFLGDRQLADKWLMYDNSVRVPLIVYDPRANKHQDINDMALNIDVPATIMNLAGVNQPKSWHGKSLLPIVQGNLKTLGRDTILIEHLWEFKDIPPSEGVRTAEWKYFRYVNDKMTEELYNLATDPLEKDNLATQKSQEKVLLSLRKKLEQLSGKYADPYSGIPSGLTVEHIRKPENARIIDPKPEFGWIVQKEAVSQNGYQILVSSSKHLIDNNIADVWDSGQIRGSRSTNVEFGGTPLKENTSHFWKVRIWDQDNRLSDYSKVQEFKTGKFGDAVTSHNIFQMERISPVSLVKKVDGSYFADFGKDAFGTLELNYKTNKIETLVISLGEKLLDGKIDAQPGGTIRYSEVKLQVSPAKVNYTIQLPVDKRNTSPAAVQLPDSFGIITPFRYAEIKNAKQPISIKDLYQKAYFHYFDESQSSFTSSDTVLNKVWDLCKYTMKATSFTGIYIDGDRERIAYEADAYINQLGHYNTDSEYAMAKQTIEYFMGHPTWPTEWLLHTAMMVYQDYLYTGDMELLRKYYGNLKNKTLIDLAREDGLISTTTSKVNGDFMLKIGFVDSTKRIKDIVDWPPAQKDTGWKLITSEGERDGHEMLPINTVVNSFFYNDMKIMAIMAGLLNQSADKDHFEMMAAKVKQSINQKLFDAKKGIYVDGEGSTHGSIHSNMTALAFGVVAPEHVKTVADFIKTRGMACSVYGSQFLLEGLYEAGEGQYALDLMRATNDRSWWNMIKSGSTIALEAWDMKYKPNSDWNHAWGAAPANIIPRFLWGIQPKVPGFGIVQIKPQMGDLKFSTIKVPTIHGPVKGEYRKVNNRLKTYTIELPANTVGEFSVGSTIDEVFQLNGEKVNPSFQSIRLNPGVNHIEIKVNSY